MIKKKSAILLEVKEGGRQLNCVPAARIWQGQSKGPARPTVCGVTPAGCREGAEGSRAGGERYWQREEKRPKYK